MSDEVKTDDFDFNDLTIQSKPLKYLKMNYMVYEAMGDAAAKYRNAMMACARKLNPDTGKPEEVQGLADTKFVLLAACIKEVLPDGTEQPVQVAAVRSWHNTVTDKVYDWIKKVSGLNEGENVKDELTKLKERVVQLEEVEEQRKNSQGATTTGGS